MQPDLLIFDFDGVVADSETLSNALLAETLTAFGLPTTTDQSMQRYMGRRWSDNLVLIGQHFGDQVPENFPGDFEAALRRVTRVRMRAEVEPVMGVAAFIAGHAHVPLCIASSSSPEWLADMTHKFGFTSHFDGRLFSVTNVARGKPAPDIFLHAADGMGIAASHRCVVIEDSAAGVTGAKAAGMTAIGFCGASHIRPGHDATLRNAGADAIATVWSDVADIIARLD